MGVASFKSDFIPTNTGTLSVIENLSCRGSESRVSECNIDLPQSINSSMMYHNILVAKVSCTGKYFHRVLVVVV